MCEFIEMPTDFDKLIKMIIDPAFYDLDLSTSFFKSMKAIVNFPSPIVESMKTFVKLPSPIVESMKTFVKL